MVDPREGIVSKTQFLPTVAEVKEWLEKTPYGAAKVLPRSKRSYFRDSPEEKRSASRRFWSERLAMSERALDSEKDPDQRKYWEEKLERAHYHLDHYDEIIKEARG